MSQETIDEVIEKIIQIPTVLNNNTWRSFYSLAVESGYFQTYDNINVDDIYKALKNKPTYVNDWIQLSADKRTSSGWFFYEKTPKNFVVVFFTNGVFSNEEFYNDIVFGCANFIKKEMEQVRKYQL